MIPHHLLSEETMLQPLFVVQLYWGVLALEKMQ